MFCQPSNPLCSPELLLFTGIAISMPLGARAVLHQMYLPGFRLLSQWGELCCAIGDSKRSK